MFRIYWTLVCGLFPLLGASTSKADANDELLFLSFFRGNGQHGVHLAASEDGRTFVPLNNDRPVFPPPVWVGQNLTRDPSIVYQDGLFHMVWTTHWTGRVFGYVTSRDLKSWSAPAQVRPFPVSLSDEQQPLNVWAPEIHWDPMHEEFFILFSSTTPLELHDGDSIIRHDLDHRTYVVRTKDGKAFSNAELFFDPGFSVIDPVLRYDDAAQQWVMIIKHELFPEDGGKNLWMVFVGKDLSDPFPPPFSEMSSPIVGPGSNVRPHWQVEGPSLLRWKECWHLYCDAFRDHRYALATSNDLETWNDESAELSVPAGARHGTVFRAPQSAVAWEIDAGGQPSKAEAP